jgi:hypothetical protein
MGNIRDIPLESNNDENLAGFNSITPSYSYGETLNATIDQSLFGFTKDLASIVNMKGREQLRSEVIDPDKLNEMFPNIEKKFYKPTKLVVAQEMSRRATENNRISNIINNGPQGFFAGAGRFATGLATGIATDPLGMLAGIGIAKSIRSIGVAAMAAGSSSRIAGIAARGGLGAEVAEGIAGTGLMSPISAYSRSLENSELKSDEIFMDLAIGAVGVPLLGAGLRYLTREGPNGVRGLPFKKDPGATPKQLEYSQEQIGYSQVLLENLQKRIGTEKTAEVLSIAYKQMNMGNRVDVDNIIKTFDDATFSLDKSFAPKDSSRFATKIDLQDEVSHALINYENVLGRDTAVSRKTLDGMTKLFNDSIESGGTVKHILSDDKYGDVFAVSSPTENGYTRGDRVHMYGFDKNGDMISKTVLDVNGSDIVENYIDPNLDNQGYGDVLFGLAHDQLGFTFNGKSSTNSPYMQAIQRKYLGKLKDDATLSGDTTVIGKGARQAGIDFYSKQGELVSADTFDPMHWKEYEDIQKEIMMEPPSKWEAEIKELQAEIAELDTITALHPEAQILLKEITDYDMIARSREVAIKATDYCIRNH